MKRLEPYEKTPMMLINDISRMFGARMRRAADEEGIPSGYRHLLFYLAHNDGVSQLELVKRTHLTAPTVSVTLQKMEHDGYITRTPDPDDQRQMKVCLTEKGQLIKRRSKDKADETEALAFADMSDTEIAEIKSYLMRIYENIRKVAPAPCELPRERNDEN